MNRLIVWTRQGAAQQFWESIREHLEAQDLSGDAGGLAEFYYDMFVNTDGKINGAIWGSDELRAWYYDHCDAVFAGDFRGLDAARVAASGYVEPNKAPSKAAAPPTSAGKKASKKATETHLGARAGRLGSSSLLPSLPSLPALGAGSSTDTSAVVPVAVGLGVVTVIGVYLYSRS